MESKYKFAIFEIPKNIDITEQLLELIAEQYDLFYSNMEEFCSYLGEISFDDTEIRITRISPTTYNYVKQKIEPKLYQELE